MKRPSVSGPDERLVVRDAPLMSLRIWTTSGFRSGSGLPSSVRVEWAGRIGHPSSYGMLGGTRSPISRVRVFPSDAKFRDALAARADDVRWGLPAEYESVVVDALHDQLLTVSVSQAAHGTVGSSPHVFRALTNLLCRLLAEGVPLEDSEIWRLRDRAWNQA